MSEAGAPGPPPAPLLSIRGLVKRRTGSDRTFELDLTALDLAPGDAVAFVGPSGCGKSTLIDLLAMTLRPDAVRAFVVTDPRTGAVTDVAGLWEKRHLDALGRLRSRYFGYVLQTGGLLPFLTVRRNIELTQRILGVEDRDWVETLLRRLDIAELGEAMPGKLSVGQRQRVAIARALAHRPALVLADEPTASLDPVNADAVMDLFLELIAGVGAALVLVTHDREQPRRFAVPAVEARVGREGTTVRTTFDPQNPGAQAAPTEKQAPAPVTGVEAAPAPVAGVEPVPEAAPSP